MNRGEVLTIIGILLALLAFQVMKGDDEEVVVVAPPPVASPTPEPFVGYCTVEFLNPFFGENAAGAAEVCFCESSGRPWVVNPLDARGLFQIIPKWHPQYDPALLLDPVYNATAAAEISNGGEDWSQWTCKPSLALIP